MGGPGSGNRWRYGAMLTTDDYCSLDIRRWAREGMLSPGYSGGWQWTHNGEVTASISMRAEEDRVVLKYRHRRGGGEWQSLEYPVWIERTACHLGGTRPWFVCPARGCGRRVAILYCGGIYACRHCHRLAYASTREDAGGRLRRRADRIRERLGWRAGILNPRGDKPKGMRWRTFRRLCAEHDHLVRESLRATAVKFGFGEP